jgi:predicted Zn-dependent protease
MNYFYKTTIFFLFIFYAIINAQYNYCHDGQGNDNNPCGAPSGNYQVSGQKWPKSELKYFFKNGTADIDGDQEKTAFYSAFNKWAEAVPFEFIEVFTESEADIKIIYMSYSEFSSFYGGETASFAAAYQPEMDCKGLLGLNDENTTFSLLENPSNAIDLFYVALHEMGHILGLCHSANSVTVMATYSGQSKRNLHSYDIEGIRSIYATVKVKNEFKNPNGFLV